MITSACILAGGLGTRLRALYADRPKALVPVCGRPFIEHMIEGLQQQGVSRFHIAAGYRAGQIKEWAKINAIAGAEITVSVEPEPLGTAGGIKFALPFLPPDFMTLILNGDSLLPKADVQEMLTACRANPTARAIIAAVEMTERGQYGTLEIDARNHITAFKEKAANDGGWVNGGIYYLDPAILDAITPGVAASIEKDIFPVLAASGQLMAVKVDGPLLDMGTPEGLERTSAYLAESGK